MTLSGCAVALVADVLGSVKRAVRALVAPSELTQRGVADNARAANGPGLLPGQATIVKIDDEPVGVFCDTSGELRAVRARCTHIDWPLEFNVSSQTWDCPRHGASFTVDGTVIRGPATSALETVCPPDTISAARPPTPSLDTERSGANAQ